MSERKFDVNAIVQEKTHEINLRITICVDHGPEVKVVASGDQGNPSFSRPNLYTNYEDVLPKVLAPKDIHRFLGCGINQVHQLIKSGEFHSVKMGNRWYISRNVFLQWLEGQPRL